MRRWGRSFPLGRSIRSTNSSSPRPARSVKRALVTWRAEHRPPWSCEAAFELVDGFWSAIEFTRNNLNDLVLPPPTPTTWRFYWDTDAAFIVPRHAFTGTWVDVALDAELSGQRDAVRTIAAEFIPARVLSLAVAVIAQAARKRRRQESRRGAAT